MRQIIERYEQLHQCTIPDSVVLAKKTRFPKGLMGLWAIVIALWAVFFFHDYFVGFGWFFLSLGLALIALFISGALIYRARHTDVMLARDGIALLEGVRFKSIPFRDLQHVRLNGDILTLESKTKTIRLSFNDYSEHLKGLVKGLKAQGYLDAEPYEHDIFFHDDQMVVIPVVESKNEDYLALRSAFKDYRYLHEGDLEDLDLQAIFVEKFKMIQKQHAAFFVSHLHLLVSHPLNNRFKPQDTGPGVVVFERFKLLEIIGETALKSTLKTFREIIPHAQVKQCLISLRDDQKVAQMVFIHDHQSYTVRFTFDEVFAAFHALASDPWYDGE